MFPAQALPDHADKRFGDVVISSNLSGRSGIGANCNDLFLRKFGFVMRLTIGMPISTFLIHVGNVVWLRAYKKMLDLDAKRRVASVADIHSRGDCPDLNGPCGTMSERIFAVPEYAAIAALGSRRPHKTACDWITFATKCEALGERGFLRKMEYLWHSFNRSGRRLRVRAGWRRVQRCLARPMVA